MKNTMKHAAVLLTLILVFTVLFSGCGSTTGDRVSSGTAPTINDETNETPTEQQSTDESNLSAHSFQALSFAGTEGGTLNYWLYIPKDATDNMPLIIYLHSATGKGEDLSILISIDGFPKYLYDGSLGEIGAYVIMPQLQPTQRSWESIEASLIELINKTVTDLNIDNAKISLTGHSVGGTGTWTLAARHPDLFSRIAPLSGGVSATSDSVNALKGLSVRTFVGSEDDVIDPAMSKRMAEELKKTGADAEITIFEGAGHEAVPSLTYLDKDLGLIDWLIGKTESAPEETTDNGMNMYSRSEFIEKEQPELTEETKKLISAYQKNPTEDNYLALREIVIENYNAVLARKEKKLAELKTETAGKPGGEAIVAEMEEIVQEMYITYWNRINSSMLRFTDTRLLKWKISAASQYEYIPVMGAGESIYVKRTPVTNKEYAEFINATGYTVPSNWINGSYPKGEDDYPVNYVSASDAEAYCRWLTEKDGMNVYRLPSESEWELAAGHMPKDADFNCGVADGRVSVEKYASVTRGAHGAVDFWGNVWEWTSTERDVDGTLGVKGGSYKSPRTDCRTEHRKEGRYAGQKYDDVGFRVIKVQNGKEPEQKVDLYTLEAPRVTIKIVTPDSAELSWEQINGAVEYQVFEYSKTTGLLRMLERTKETTFTVPKTSGSENIGYIVQALSYKELSDNVNVDNVVSMKN